MEEIKRIKNEADAILAKFYFEEYNKVLSKPIDGDTNNIKTYIMKKLLEVTSDANLIKYIKNE